MVASSLIKLELDCVQEEQQPQGKPSVTVHRSVCEIKAITGRIIAILKVDLNTSRRAVLGAETRSFLE